MESLKRALASPATALLGWAALALSVYPTLWGKDGAGAFKLDAWIYHHAVAQWHAGGSLYDWYANPDQQLWPFTYPPFAAWAMTPLTWWPDRATQVALVAATPVATAVTAWAVLHALGVPGRITRGAAPWLALAAVLLLEPVPKTMEYGQVNAVLMALVALDLLVVPSSSRLRGVSAGLAAAFKLTPAIAVLVLAARREWRAAATMVGSALAVTALSWAASPDESARFFFSAMWDSSRAGLTDYSGNQNLKGLVARWLPPAAWDAVWAGLAAVGVVLAWLLLVRLNRLRATAAAGSRRAPGGPPADGVVLVLQTVVAMTLGLLISPISWSHHWVWCLPALMGLVAAGLAWDSAALLQVAAAGAAVFGLAMQWWFPEQNHVEQDWPFWATVVGSSYTWWALATGVVMWRVAGRHIDRTQHVTSTDLGEGRGTGRTPHRLPRPEPPGRDDRP
ncbi:DUF2029 domain-containing protein [Actinomyces sp. 594]|uniref:glycosyltransferase 87 family protein n=1 Tax=Actinomyces sp. 594 TaxID=2057793 RepID=UPI001C577BD2|nr:glycosyltransferase 87 family protein [Actinomyces sp. 594]MBW3069189.1 DUF2029 domain-containing protein [Actinomyces sp. 594]